VRRSQTEARTGKDRAKSRNAAQILLFKKKKMEAVILSEKGREAMMKKTFLLAFATFILFV
jgi:hypothetical protein